MKEVSFLSSDDALTITEIALEVEITISNIVNANYNINRAGTPPTKG